MAALTKRTVKGYGWRPSLPDQRDLQFTDKVSTLPTSVDLRSKCPPVYDQGQLGSCTGNAIAGMVQFNRMKQALENPALVPSRLFIYYNERVIEGTVSYDAGAEPRDGLKAVANLGVCFESGPSAWPYEVSKFKTKPSSGSFMVAETDKALKYHAIAQLLERFQTVLAGGYPFIMGITVYESFESDTVAKTGVVPMPSAHEKTLGGHCIGVVGYDNASERFICRNSWGPDWGQDGYFTIPYDYVTNPNLASDFWVIRSME